MNCEDLYTDRQWKVCQAFATFVARRTEAGKVSDNKHNTAARESQTKPVPMLLWCFFCVHRCNWSKWFLAHSWSRWSTAWRQSGGGWGSSTLRSLPTYWAAARLSQVPAAHMGALWRGSRRCGRLMSCSCFGFPRRMPGVPGCRAGRADASGERGAGTAAAYEPPSQHLWGPDYGVDGERGYDFCEVCTNSPGHPLPSCPLENTKVFQV